MGRRAIIIGAGPAGLTAALEMLRRTDITPVVLEAGDAVGGLSRTVRYKGNRMDIGGHRFFSKSDRVMQWWLDLLPPEAEADISYRGERTRVHPPSTESPEPSTPQRAADDVSHARRPAWGGSIHRPHSPELQGDTAVLSTAASSTVLEEEDRSVVTAVIRTETVDEDLFQEDDPDAATTLSSAAVRSADPDRVMLIRPRRSRIYFLRRFFDYPLRLTLRTLLTLGPVRSLRIAASYLRCRLRRITPERTLEDFFINRFGRELYLTFFKSYTEKVWGVPCREISAEWGAQRVRGLSLTSAVRHFVRRSIRRSSGQAFAPLAGREAPTASQTTETSLIERFLYPKLGPGQLWEHVAHLVRGRGGELHTGWKVDRIHREGDRVAALEAVHVSGVRERFAGDLFFSTMPMQNLVRAMDPPAPPAVRAISDGLQYRDFITVGLLVNRLRLREEDGSPLRDTWIYVQESDVKLGRLQIFNNWSPSLVADPDKMWLGLEYFCSEKDDLWTMADDALIRFAVSELASIGMLDPTEVCDAHVVRVPKSYPAYFGAYSRFEELRAWTDRIDNLFLLGRNGMHKYNNQDHSMLTAMTAVDGIVDGAIDKAALWAINTEPQYHEERA